MRKITYCLILFLFIYPLSLMADNGLNESVLKELDRVIEEKYSFHVHKEKEIDEIKARLHRYRPTFTVRRFAFLSLSALSGRFFFILYK